MKLWMTGGLGFVGSNIVHAAAAAGHEVMTTAHSAPPAAPMCPTAQVDMTDADAVAASVAEFDPDLVVHCAILTGLERLEHERRAGWSAYVDATRATAAAAADAGAAYVLVSTDWVFDGTGHRVAEDEPPNPRNAYGLLKMASELVAIERGGAVARVSGVNGVHRARPDAPRAQDPGFGNFLSPLVDEVRQGRPFALWEADDINMVATPSLALECGEIIVEIGERGLDGIFHCCGADAVGRMELARLTCDVFDLDPELVVSTSPDPAARGSARIPYDTSLSTPRTDEVLGRTATPIPTLLERFRAEYEGEIP